MKPGLSSFAIAVRLSGAFGLLAVLFCVVAWEGFEHLKSDSQSDAEIYGLQQTEQLAHESFRLSEENGRITLQLFLIEDPNEIKPLLAQRDSNSERISQLHGMIEGRLKSDEEKRLFRLVKAARAVYVDNYRRAMTSLIAENKRDQARQMMLETGRPLLRNYYDAVAAFDQYEIETLDKLEVENRNADAFDQRDFSFVVTLAGLTIIGIGIFTVLGMRRVIADRFRAEQALREGQAQLERRIQDRTVELQRMNEGLRKEMAERQRAEATIKQFPAIIESSDDAIISKTLDGIVTTWNPAAEQMFGYTAEEIIGKPITILFPPDRIQEEKRILSLIAIGEHVSHFETVRVRKDGTLINVSATISPIRDADRKITGISKIVRDITERRLAEEAIQESEAKFRALFEAANDNIFLLHDGIFVDCNAKGLELFGVTRDQIIGKSPVHFSPPSQPDGRDSSEKAMEGVQRTLAGEPQFVQWLHQRPDGTLLHTEVSLNRLNLNGKVHIQAIVRDITERKHAEESLKLFRTLVDHSNDSIEVLDAETGQFLDVNESSCRRLGYSREEMLALRLPDIIDSGGEAFSIKALVEETRKLGSRTIEARERRKDRSTLPVEVNVQYIELNRGYLLVFVRDISERKRAEHKIAETQSRYQALFENMLGGYAYCQIVAEQGQARDFIYLDVNSAFEMLTGLKNVVGKKVSELIPGIQETNPELFEIYGRVALSGKPEKYETYVKALEVWFSISVYSNEKDHFVAIFENITDRKLSEERIAEQAAFLDKAQDAILVCDLKGKVLYWNKGAENMYGWSREEILGRKISETLHASSGIFAANLNRVLDKGEFSDEAEHQTKKGRKLNVEVRRTLIRNPEGRPKSILAIITDITDKKKIEAQFMRAQRMESIGTLAGGIAHDLNNILAPIMMSIGVLRNTVSDPQSAEILDTIEVSAERGADIVRQVLSFARGMDGQRVEMQLKHLIRDLEKSSKTPFPRTFA